MSQIDIC